MDHNLVVFIANICAVVSVANTVVLVSRQNTDLIQYCVFTVFYYSCSCLILAFTLLQFELYNLKLLLKLEPSRLDFILALLLK